MLRLTLFSTLIVFQTGLWAETIKDCSQINQATVKHHLKLTDLSEKQLSKLIKDCSSSHTNITVAGSRHTQGGHILCQDSIFLDSKGFKKIELIDSNTIRTQAGATWKDIIGFLNPLGKSVDIMQSDHEFSIGGSLAANVHGWQFKKAPIIQSIKSFRIMLSDGEIINCSRQENSDIFFSAIGGYGLLGIILDVDLNIVDNFSYTLKNKVVKSDQFLPVFYKQFFPNPNNELFFARFRMDEAGFLDELIMRTYKKTGPPVKNSRIIQTSNFAFIARNLFALTSKFDFAKKLRWLIESSSSVKATYKNWPRNQLLTQSTSLYLNQNPLKTDLLQEFFVPVEAFNDFVNFLKTMKKDLTKHLLNITVRFVRQDEESLLKYAKHDSMAFVMFFRGPRTKSFDQYMAQMARKITAKALELGGAYYLPYRPYQTFKQFNNCYPAWKKFLELKQSLDPNSIFSNYFFQNYFLKNPLNSKF